MTSIVVKQEAARPPLGRRWQVKWHFKKWQGPNKQAGAGAGAGVRDEIHTDIGDIGVTHAAMDSIVGSMNSEQNQARLSCGIASPNVVRSDYFPRKRCRTWRRSSKLHAEMETGRVAVHPPSNRSPSLLRLCIPATTLAAKFVLRLAGLAGLRAIFSGACWPILRVVCLSGFAKNPLTRVARLAIPGRRSRTTKCRSPDPSTPPPARGPLGVAMEAGITTLSALQSLGPPLLCAQALMLVISARSRLITSQPDNELSMHVGTLGPDYSEYLPSPDSAGRPQVGLITPPVCQGDSSTIDNADVEWKPFHVTCQSNHSMTREGSSGHLK